MIVTDPPLGGTVSPSYNGMLIIESLFITISFAWTDVPTNGLFGPAVKIAGKSWINESCPPPGF